MFRGGQKQNVKILIIDNFLSCHLIMKILYIYRTWKYIAKMEVEICLRVMVSMVIIR